SLARLGLNIGNTINSVFGKRSMTVLTGGIRKLFSSFPLWSTQLGAPPSLPRLPVKDVQAVSGENRVVYFPACISRLMGTGAGAKKNIMEAFISVSSKVGIEVVIPDNI